MAIVIKIVVASVSNVAQVFRIGGLFHILSSPAKDVRKRAKKAQTDSMSMEIATWAPHLLRLKAAPNTNVGIHRALIAARA